MTTDRQALRAKHQPDENGYCKTCANRNFDGSTSVREWPCDAINILNAWEEWERFDAAMLELNEISEELGLPE